MLKNNVEVRLVQYITQGSNWYLLLFARIWASTKIKPIKEMGQLSGAFPKVEKENPFPSNKKSSYTFKK